MLDSLGSLVKISQDVTPARLKNLSEIIISVKSIFIEVISLGNVAGESTSKLKDLIRITSVSLVLSNLLNSISKIITSAAGLTPKRVEGLLEVLRVINLLLTSINQMVQPANSSFKDIAKQVLLLQFTLLPIVNAIGNILKAAMNITPQAIAGIAQFVSG
jgi:hypothetical protein